jgi:hypothetical protein
MTKLLFIHIFVDLMLRLLSCEVTSLSWCVWLLWRNSRKLLESECYLSGLVVTQPCWKHGQPQGGKHQPSVADIFGSLARRCINKTHIEGIFLIPWGPVWKAIFIVSESHKNMNNNQTYSVSALGQRVKEPDELWMYDTNDKSKFSLTFCWPCIMIYLYNRSQQDALFLNYILIYNCTCFGQTYCLSLGVLEYCIQDSWWWTVSLSKTCGVVFQNKVEQ